MPSISDRHQAQKEIALWPLRLLLPLKHVHAQVELQNARRNRLAPATSLGGLTLLPLYSLEQTKAAIVRHAYETAKHLISHSRERDLATCLSHPYRKHGTESEDRILAYSIGYVCNSISAAGRTFERNDVLIRTDNAEVWVEVKQNNMLTILNELVAGRGKLAVRVWYYWPRAEKLRSYYSAGEHSESAALHHRICEEGSLGSGRPGSGAGSDAGSGCTCAGSGYVGPIVLGGGADIRHCDTC